MVMRLFLLGACLVFGTSGFFGYIQKVEAATVTYSVTGAASGTLGGTDFVNAAISLSFVGDTSNVEAIGGFFFQNAIGTASVTVAGVTSGAVFTDAVVAFVNQLSPFAGIASVDAGTTI